MTITLEDFKESDFERCLEIRIQNYNEVNKIPKNIPWVREHFLANLKTRTYFVAKDWDLVVGIWGYYENHLSTFFVDPAYQWQWIWKLLLERVLSEVQKLWYKDANLNSSDYAKNFYEHFWFVVVEHKKEGGYVMTKTF
jgi:GNAT superfamily N-acetyltransferase